MKFFSKIFSPTSCLIFALQSSAFAGNTPTKPLKDEETLIADSSTILEIESIQDLEFATVFQTIPQKEMTGEEFKKHFEGSRFIKILNQKENHHGFQYKGGLCQLVEDFCPSGSCQAGGLYFTTLGSAHEFFSFGDHARILEIPDDARIWPEGNKYKADKLFLCDCVPINQVKNLKRKNGKKTCEKLEASLSAEHYSLKMALESAKNNNEPNLEPFMEHLNEKVSKFIEQKINSTSDMLKLYLSYSAAYYAASYAAYSAAYYAAYYAAYSAASDAAYSAASKKNWWIFSNYKLIGRYSYKAAEWASLVSFSENIEKILDLSLEAVNDYKFSISKERLIESFDTLQKNKNKSTALFLSPMTIMKDHLEHLDD